MKYHRTPNERKMVVFRSANMQIFLILPLPFVP